MPCLPCLFGQTARQTGLGKQYRPRSDAARGAWSGSMLFAIHPVILPTPTGNKTTWSNFRTNMAGRLRCPNSYAKYDIKKQKEEIITLRKHAYSNILKILPPKNENFQIKNSDVFHISAQNIDYGYSLEPPRRGGSNDYPQSMFLSRNKKNNVYPCKPQFYYIKVGFKEVKII